MKKLLFALVIGILCVSTALGGYRYKWADENGVLRLYAADDDGSGSALTWTEILEADAANSSLTISPAAGVMASIGSNATAAVGLAARVGTNETSISSILLRVGSNETALVGVFYADGSVKATGDWDMDGNSLLNVGTNSITFEDGTVFSAGTASSLVAAAGALQNLVEAGWDGAAFGTNATAQQGGALGSSARTEHGGAVGGLASSTNGFAGGYNASSDSGCAAGNNASSELGGVALGDAAYSYNGGAAMGEGCGSYGGLAAGYYARELGSGVTLGYANWSSNGVAIGKFASCGLDVTSAVSAVQIGTGTNNSPGTVQFFVWQLLDAAGNIVTDRLTNAFPVALSQTITNVIWNDGATTGDWTFVNGRLTAVTP